MKEYSEELSGNKQSRVIDAFEQAYIVCRNIEEFCHLHGFKENIPQTKDVWKQALEICRYVNQMMEERVDVKAMSEDEDEDMRFLGKLVLRYKSLLERKNVMDFSSIQTETLEMLDRDERILQAVRDKIRYIMVDEYQDTNYIQEQLVFKLAGKTRNICVVGDDDQGMYRFRGATIRNILEFAGNFEKDECKVFYLDENYRSEPGIIRFYSSWMSDDNSEFDWGKYRFSKQLQACKPGKSDAPAVFACGGDSLDAEKEELLALIKNLKANGNITDLNQIAFLFRSVKGSEAKGIAEHLEANGFPVYSPRSDMFFERTEVKQVLGCIMFCFNVQEVHHMKLATALSERADLQTRVHELSQRLNSNAKVQEGEKPSEEPLELISELERCMSRLEELIIKINITNSSTKLDGLTITEYIAKRDVLKQKIKIYRDFLTIASNKIDRYSNKEIKILSTVDVAEMQKQLDGYSKELRLLDDKLQEANWTTELL